MKDGWTLLLTFVLVGCAAPPAGGPKEPVTTVKSEIVAGSAHSGDPAVVYLIYSSGALCTGSLIAPKAVLTARHCVEQEDGTPMEPTHVGTGTTSGETTYAAVTGVRKAPGTWADADVAVLLLDAAGSLTPYSWGGVPSSGDRVVGIGFGRTDTDAGDSGTKRRGESTVGSVDTNTFTTSGALGCYGDSGGPAFVDGRVVGVAANISDTSCSASVTNYMRVDVHRSFIEGAITESEGGPRAAPDGSDPGGSDPGGSDPGGSDPGGSDPAPPSGGTCLDTCPYAFDGECDDGGPGSLYSVCALGTDCGDCGARSGGSDPGAGDPGGSDPGGADPGAGGTCSDTCTWFADGECDDGGPGSLYSVCPLGTDCSDCGSR